MLNTTPQPAPPAPDPRVSFDSQTRTRRMRTIPRQPALIGVMVLLILVMTGNLAGCSPTATPASPTPTATATVNPNESAPAYKDAVKTAYDTVDAATKKFVQDCENATSYTTTCRNDLQAVHDAVNTFQNALDHNSAPPCLKNPDTLLREALRDYHDGLTLIMAGLDNEDATSVDVGIQMLNDGDDEMNHAGVLLDEATC